jgi:hypothetical protein
MTLPTESHDRLSTDRPDAGEDVTTQAGPSASPAHRSASPTITPEMALAKDEVERSRLFLKLCAVLAGAVGLLIPFVTGSVTMRATVVACCAAVIVGTLAFRRSLHDDQLSTPRRWVMVCALLVAGSAIAVWFFGVYSPAPMVGTFGIYFLCLGRSMRVALWAYLGGAASHLVPAVLVALRVLPDPGLLTPQAGTRDLLVAAAIVQIVFAATFALARGSRLATRDAVVKLHAALAQVQKREALLAEANLELDQALQAGQRGPFTDRRVGDYVLGPVIGRGAMGDVYEGLRMGGGERAAVKILHRVLAMDPSHVQRFLREAQIVSRLTSPHVVKLVGSGNFEPAGDGQDAPPYLAMELLDGHDLAWQLRREGRMVAEDALSMIDQVSEALADAAAAGIVHRDLKPQNIFLARGPGAAAEWKVLDFGVSKLLSESHGTLTHGAPIGTPAYMAPEQARGASVDARADVFSLACIAYRALTGRPAFAGNDLPQILFDVCFAQPMRPGAFAPLAADVERTLALGLAKEPEDRLDSALGFAAALRAAVTEALPDPLRVRADALLAEAPWGSRPR